MISVRVIHDLQNMETFVPLLEDLSADLSEPNVFYEPWHLLPMLRRFGAGERFDFVLLFMDTPDGTGALCGFFPLVRSILSPLLPVRCHRMWCMRYCWRCTPLIRAGMEDPCLEAFFRWLRQDPKSLRLLDLPEFRSGGALQSAFERQISANPGLRSVLSISRSALIQRAESADSYLKRNFSSRSLQQFRRKRRKLSDLGEVVFSEPEGTEDLEAVINEFLALESSGWKGRDGTSLASRSLDRGYFGEIMRKAFERRRVSLFCLRIGGRLVSAKCTFLAPPGSFIFKIAYDEAFAKYSPGLLLEIEDLHRLHGGKEEYQQIEWTDSCAASESNLYNRVGSEMRAIHRYRIGASFGPKGLLMVVLPHLLRLRHAFSRSDPR